MDGARLQLSAGEFDAIIGRNSMQFLPGWPHPLTEFIRVLRPGGRLAFVVWGPREANRYFDLPVVVAQEKGLLRVPGDSVRLAYGLADAGRLRADLTQAGFEQVSVEPVHGLLETSDSGPLLSYLRDGPAFRAINGEYGQAEQREYDESLISALEQFRGDRGYRVDALALLASGRR
jgi:SAM-dependent methyltransferase